MDPIGTLTVALVGVAMVGGWIGAVRHDPRPKAPAARRRPAVNGWTGKPSTIGLPRVARHGFGVRITHAPARARRFSAFAYPGMWAGLHR